jgi:hypothetical protein
MTKSKRFWVAPAGSPMWIIVASGVLVASLSNLALDRIGWKVVIASHYDGLVTLGQHGSVPDSFIIGFLFQIVKCHKRQWLSNLANVEGF